MNAHLRGRTTKRKTGKMDNLRPDPASLGNKFPWSVGPVEPKNGPLVKKYWLCPNQVGLVGLSALKIRNIRSFISISKVESREDWGGYRLLWRWTIKGLDRPQDGSLQWTLKQEKK